MNPSHKCLYNAKAFRRFSKASSSLVDVVTVGDSISYTNGGFTRGSTQACATRGCGGKGYLGGNYATGLYTTGHNWPSSYAQAYGLNCAMGGITSTGSNNGAPAGNEAFFNPVDYAESLGTPNYTYITGSTAPTAQFGFITASQASGFMLPHTEAWEFHTRHGKFTSGTTCTPFMRTAGTNVNQSGFQSLQMSFTGTAGDTQYQIRSISEEAVRNVAATGSNIYYSSATGSLGSASGATPAMMYWHRLMTQRRQGVSFTPLIEKGGKTSLDMYNALNSMPDDQFSYFISDVLYKQGQSSKPFNLVFFIEYGPNDAGAPGAAQTSLDGVNAQNTKAGFKFTCREFLRMLGQKLYYTPDYSLLSGIEQLYDYPISCSFILVGPHPVEDASRNSLYSQFTDAMCEIVDEQEFNSFCGVWDWRPAFTTTEALSRSWYANAVTDQIHLSSTGAVQVYEHLWRTIDSGMFNRSKRERNYRVTRGRRL